MKHTSRPSKVWILTIVCIIFFPDATRAQKKTRKQSNEIQYADLLAPFYDLSGLPAYEDVYCAQVSSYDTTGANDDGFSGRYSFIRRNPDSTLVIFDEKGPGVINRMWTPTPSDDSLAFYIDDMKKPAFTILYRDLFSGNVFPFVEPLCGNQLGGFFSYLPIPFQKHCRIVYLGKKTQFHQIQYKRYPKGTIIKSFSLDFAEGDRTRLSAIKMLWQKPVKSVYDFYPEHPAIQSSFDSITLDPGTTATIFKLETGGRIVGMVMSPKAALEGLTKDIDLRITWDGEQTPAVFCPAADFFGYAFGKASMRSLVSGTDEATCYSFWPMPFDKSAKVELIYRREDRGSAPITLATKVYYENKPRDTAKEGKFYAYWNRNSRTQPHEPHILLAATGKGHSVATLLQAQGLKAGMTYFFEGDDSTVVDGAMRMHGTGSEDYFNGGWYALADRWDAAMSLPLSGALDYSLPLCRTGGYRLFLSDKISFNQTIYTSIEHGPIRNEAPADYTSLSFYYCHQSNAAYAVAPSMANTKVVRLDTMTLYPQLMNLTVDGEISIKPEWKYPTGGQTFTCTATNGSALRISLAEIPHGTYRMFMDFVTGPNGCLFSIWQRQSQLTPWRNSESPKMQRNEKMDLGEITLNDLIHTLTLRFQTAPGKDQFVLNRIILVKK